jgi:hypothetical protein
VSALAVAACSSPPPSYEESLTRAREEKNAMLRESSESPVPAAQRSAWPALQYFSIDESYRAPASLSPPATATDVIVMPTSTGKQRQMRRAGTLQFAIKGQPLRLTAFTDLESPVPQRLFVPFGDLTNGKETYPGGRYLDLDPTATGLYEIDFNRAYSPYCAYNPEYDCPYPPKENRLNVEIRAGEKVLPQP